MATNDVYFNPGTTRTWTDTGGDEQLDLGNLAPAGIIVGSYHDLGAAARPREYQWKLIIDGFTANPSAVGQTIELYFTMADADPAASGQFDGQLLTKPTDTAQAASAPAVAMLRNMVEAGAVATYSTTASSAQILQARGTVELTGRWVAPIVYNNASATLKAAGDAHIVTLTAIPFQTQS